jgi:hypothetical protein
VSGDGRSEAADQQGRVASASANGSIHCSKLSCQVLSKLRPNPQGHEAALEALNRNAIQLIGQFLEMAIECD